MTIVPNKIILDRFITDRAYIKLVKYEPLPPTDEEERANLATIERLVMQWQQSQMRKAREEQAMDSVLRRLYEEKYANRLQ